MKHLFFLALTMAAASPVQAGDALAGDWPQWRGPQFNGSSEERNLPSLWSQAENIAWSAELPGEAASTPVVCADRVFLSGVDAAKDALVVMAFDRQSGKRLWQHEVARGIRKDKRSNFASSSPVTDGRVVVFFFGNGDLAAYGADGGRLWMRNLQKEFGAFRFGWTFSSSPLWYDGKLYMQILQRDVPVQRDRGEEGKKDSFLLALDPYTGKTLWRALRPSQAVEESREAFTTPIPYDDGKRRQLLVAGGDALTGHDPATGKELWRWGTWNPQRIGHWRLVVSPVAGDGIALACAPKREPVYAIRTDGSGLLDDRAVAWISREAKEVTSDVPTPAFYDGDFFVLSDVRKSLSRVEPRSGKVKWSVPTPGRAKYEASPLAADGKIYCINFEGQVAVFDAASGKVLHTIAMDSPSDGEVVRASIIAAHGQLFIRTTRKLYCVGKKK